MLRAKPLAYVVGPLASCGSSIIGQCALGLALVALLGAEGSLLCLHCSLEPGNL